MEKGKKKFLAVAVALGLVFGFNAPLWAQEEDYMGSGMSEEQFWQMSPEERAAFETQDPYISPEPALPQVVEHEYLVPGAPPLSWVEDYPVFGVVDYPYPAAFQSLEPTIAAPPAKATTQRSDLIKGIVSGEINDSGVLNPNAVQRAQEKLDQKIAVPATPESEVDRKIRRIETQLDSLTKTQLYVDGSSLNKDTVNRQIEKLGNELQQLGRVRDILVGREVNLQKLSEYLRTQEREH
jgi:hypothetical protein